MIVNLRNTFLRRNSLDAPRFRNAPVPSEGAPEKEGTKHRTGASEPHAHWIFCPPRWVRVVLGPQGGAGAPPTVKFCILL